MSECLKRLINTGSFSIIQERVEHWYRFYNTNSCEENVAQACELIELNAQVQGQLFRLLSLCAAQGDLPSSVKQLKSRLLPLLGHSFFSSGITSTTSLQVLADAKTRSGILVQEPGSGGVDGRSKIRRDVTARAKATQSEDTISLARLERMLEETRKQNHSLKKQLENANTDLDLQERSSVTDKMFVESEITDLHSQLAIAEREKQLLHKRLIDYEKELSAVLEETGRRSCPAHDIRVKRSSSPMHQIQRHESRSSSSHRMSSPSRVPPPISNSSAPCHCSVPPLHFPRSSPHPCAGPPGFRDLVDGMEDEVDNSDEAQGATRLQELVQRYNDLFSGHRIEAMNLLQTGKLDHEDGQKVVFNAIVECFTSARIHIRNVKARMKAHMSRAHPGLGSEDLENTIEEHMEKITSRECRDLPQLCQEIIKAMDQSSKIRLPSGMSSQLIGCFLRDAVQLAWEFQGLHKPVDVAVACPAELFDEHKYRRSYDSDVNAPLVSHHIWPSLMQGTMVLVKGEVCTRKGIHLSEDGNDQDIKSDLERRSNSSRKKSSRMTNGKAMSSDFTPGSSVVYS